MFECFMIHTSLFMSIVDRQAWSDWLYGLVFFGFIAYGFNHLVSGNQIFIIYGVLVLNRILLGLLRGDIDKRQEEIMSIVYFTIYLVLIVFVAMVSGLIPRYGLTEEFLSAANYIDVKRLDIKFELIDMPHVAMCFGVLYYLALTLVDVYSIKHKLAKRER